jgi:hypothetical protein
MTEKRKEEQRIISKLDASQLNSESNSINVYKETESVPYNFTHGLDLPSDTLIASPFQAQPIKSNPDPVLQAENQPFSREVDISGLEKELRKKGRI